MTEQAALVAAWAGTWGSRTGGVSPSLPRALSDTRLTSMGFESALLQWETRGGSFLANGGMSFRGYAKDLFLFFPDLD